MDLVELLELMEEFKKLDHQLGDNYVFNTSYVELWADGTGVLHYELFRKNTGQTPLQQIFDAIGMTSVKKSVNFHTIDDLVDLLKTPIKTNAAS